jgi:hypothetical protein
MLDRVARKKARQFPVFRSGRVEHRPWARLNVGPEERRPRNRYPLPFVEGMDMMIRTPAF